MRAPATGLAPGTRYADTCPFCHRVKPALVPNQTLPSLAATTELRLESHDAWFEDSVAAAELRKRSRPPLVATHTLPSRSSAIARTRSPDKPSAWVYASV